MAKLFNDLNLTNQPSRNGFALPESLKFSAKCGELLPVYHRTMMPGDNFQIDIKHFTRTKSVNTAAYTKFKEYFDCFFVPYRILNHNVPQVLTQNIENSNTALSQTASRSVGTQLPHFEHDDIFNTKHSYLINSSEPCVLTKLSAQTNYFGFNRGRGAAKLLSYLGYCEITDDDFSNYFDHEIRTADESKRYFQAFSPNLCALPLLAYQCIYYNFFRNSNWENNQAYNYNADYLNRDMLISFQGIYHNNDYWKSPTMFDLQYSNYPKDLFFGILPSPQYGDTAVVDVEGTVEFPSKLPIVDSAGSAVAVGATDGLKQNNITSLGSKADLVLGSALMARNEKVLKNIQGQFDILQLRKQQALQRYKEIVGSGKRDYQNLIKKIFGVEISDELAEIPQYLGGNSSILSIDQVTNQNLEGDNQPSLKGIGAQSAETGQINFTAKEHGIFMVIYHVDPIIDYMNNAYHFDVVKTEVDDYANPVFDRLGYQGLPLWFLDVSPRVVGGKSITSGNVPDVGYTTRYFDYKTGVDRVKGNFRQNEMRRWFTPVDFSSIDQIFKIEDGKIVGDVTAQWFKVDPRLPAPENGLGIFAIVANDKLNTDYFDVDTTFMIEAVRNLDYLGVPY